LDDESDYVVGSIIAVNLEGDKFAVTIDKAKGYYESEVGNQAGFGVEDFTVVETEIAMENKVKVTYDEINGRISATRIEKYSD
jgi:hypothetical protein